MREQAVSIENITARFRAHGMTPTAVDYIAAGVHPIKAWLYVRGLKAEAILKRTGFAERQLKLWPEAMPKPTPEMLLEWALTPISDKDTAATQFGSIRFGWKDIYEICELLDITPERLVPRNKSVYSDQFFTEPVLPEIVEAGAHMLIDQTARGINEPLLNFMIAECCKADKLGFEKLLPEYPPNEDMIKFAESAYEPTAEHTPEALMTSDGEKPDDVSPVLIIYNEIREMCAAFERQLFEYAKKIADEIKLHSRSKEQYQRVLWDCSSAVAQTSQGSAWMVAFNEAMNKKGLEWAIKEVMADPEAFYPVRQLFSSTTVTLSDGRTINGGRNIVKAFCEAYRSFVKCAPEKDRLKKLAELMGKHDETVTRMTDFRTWIQAPQTDRYLWALANSRYIEQQLGGWVPGPGDRLKPPAVERKVLRITYQPPSADKPPSSNPSR